MNCIDIKHLFNLVKAQPFLDKVELRQVKAEIPNAMLLFNGDIEQGNTSTLALVMSSLAKEYNIDLN